MRARGALVVVVLAGAWVFAASGCSPIRPGMPSDGPLAVYPRPDAGMDALLEGVLVLGEDCVAVRADDGSATVPVFPAGDAELDGETLVWRGAVYRDGAPIALGGGYGRVEGGDAYVPEGCVGLGQFIVSPF